MHFIKVKFGLLGKVNYDTAANRIAKNHKVRTFRVSTLDAFASFRYLKTKELFVLFCLYINMPCLLFAVAFNLEEATTLATV